MISAAAAVARLEVRAMPALRTKEKNQITYTAHRLWCEYGPLLAILKVGLASGVTGVTPPEVAGVAAAGAAGAAEGSMEASVVSMDFHS